LEQGRRAVKQPVLELAGVTVHRGADDVVRDLNWTVRPGEQWAVIGANGAGKSSLAAALCGQAAVSGEVCYGWDDESNDPTQRVALVSFQLHKAYVAQADGYYQSRWYPGEEEHPITAGAALGLHGGLRALPRAARTRVSETLSALGVLNVLDRQTLHLSTGELRRLLIARALLSAPGVLVLDEPFIGLDVKGRAALSQALRAIMRRKLPLLFMTARPWELPPGITHGLFLKDGVVLGTARRASPQFTRLLNRAIPKAKRIAIPKTKRKTRIASKAPLVDVRDIHINAGGEPILTQLNWVVRAGEHWAVTGPNGAGKTTLLSLLTGDHPQSFAQHVAMFGKLRGEQSLWELRAGIGHAAPDIALHYDGLIGTLELVCTGFFETLGLYRACSPLQTRRARAVLEALGLSGLADKPFRILSDGQQRLALLARALVKLPRLLILDEPFQGLDAAARARVFAVLRDYCREPGRSLIVVSHYEDELFAELTHGLALRRGKQAVQTERRSQRR
jgi:molybdate transport system ATP-binding protein